MTTTLHVRPNPNNRPKGGGVCARRSRTDI
jgi:hypothetical protein